jgi:cytochrome P450
MVNERTALLKGNQSIPRHVTERGIVDELSNLIFAGTDTTGNTLTYLFYDLAHHPEWQLRLHQELKDAIGEQVSPDYSAISQLPVLEAVVQEIFRLRPASPDGLLRVTPKGGALIDNVYVPAGVCNHPCVLQLSSYSNQQDEKRHHPVD